jgi:hypothetical protein
MGLQEAPHLQDLKQNHSANAKSRNSKQDFSLKRNPLVLFRRTFKG